MTEKVDKEKNIQEPPAVYLDEYTGKRVYQEGLEEDDQALYRAAAVTVRQQSLPIQKRTICRRF